MFQNFVLGRDDSDIDILQQIKAGDENALSVLFNRYYQSLCRFIFVFIQEHKVVEELSANVFINLWENRRKVVIHTSVRAYLFQAVKNQAISFLRKKDKNQNPLDEILDFPAKKDQNPENIYIDNELNREFTAAYKKLPVKAQLAFKLHRIEGLKYVEVAEIMNVSVAAVEKNITTALKILNRELLAYTKLY